MPAPAPWWERLTPETLKELRTRYPTLSFDEIAMEAMKRPSFAADFERLGAWIETFEEYSAFGAAPGVIHVPMPPEDFPRLHVLAGSETAFCNLVVAALLEDDGADGDRLQRRDPLPVPAATEVVRLRVVEEKSWPKIKAEVRLSNRKVNYINLALKHGDLGWDLDRRCITLGPETRNTRAGLVLPAR